MAQTSVDWLIEQLRGYDDKGYFIFNGVVNSELIEQAKEMHKAECISFSEQWELRCNECNMDSKEQLYDETYKQ